MCNCIQVILYNIGTLVCASTGSRERICWNSKRIFEISKYDMWHVCACTSRVPRLHRRFCRTRVPPKTRHRRWMGPASLPRNDGVISRMFDSRRRGGGSVGGMPIDTGQYFMYTFSFRFVFFFFPFRFIRRKYKIHVDTIVYSIRVTGVCYFSRSFYWKKLHYIPYIAFARAGCYEK